MASLVVFLTCLISAINLYIKQLYYIEHVIIKYVSIEKRYEKLINQGEAVCDKDKGVKINSPCGAWSPKIWKSCGGFEARVDVFINSL